MTGGYILSTAFEHAIGAVFREFVSGNTLTWRLHDKHPGPNLDQNLFDGDGRPQVWVLGETEKLVWTMPEKQLLRAERTYRLWLVAVNSLTNIPLMMYPEEIIVASGRDVTVYDAQFPSITLPDGTHLGPALYLRGEE